MADSAPMVRYYDRMAAEKAQVKLRLAEAYDLLARFAESDDPCRFDHHGFCQEHGHNPPCAVAEARRLLGLNGGDHV